jgi:ribose 5-phosphate isomerase RpiB
MFKIVFVVASAYMARGWNNAPVLACSRGCVQKWVFHNGVNFLSAGKATFFG